MKEEMAANRKEANDQIKLAYAKSNDNVSNHDDSNASTPKQHRTTNPTLHPPNLNHTVLMHKSHRPPNTSTITDPNKARAILHPKRRHLLYNDWPNQLRIWHALQGIYSLNHLLQEQHSLLKPKWMHSCRSNNRILKRFQPAPHHLQRSLRVHKNDSKTGNSMMNLKTFNLSMNPLTVRELVVEDCKWLYTLSRS